MSSKIAKTILVMGATGNLGRAVVKALTQKGFDVKAGSTKPKKASPPPGVKAVKVVYEEPGTVTAALEGVDGLFLVAPPLDFDAPAKLKPAIDQAKSAGLGHIIFNSAYGMDQNEEAPLRVIERYLMASGVNYTILRPNFFMENFSTGFIAPMIAQGGIFLAAGNAKTSFISAADIAEIAARSFQNEHYGIAYNLSGPQALNHAEVASIISEVSGKEVIYHAISEEAMLQGARGSGLPEGAVKYLAFLYEAVRHDWMAVITEDVKKATGRAPISFAEFALKNAACWK
jgi:uncharacterized protein YbjT (DUF2867 family)